MTGCYPEIHFWMISFTSDIDVVVDMQTIPTEYQDVSSTTHLTL